MESTRITIAVKFACGHAYLDSIVASSSRSSQQSRSLWSRVRRSTPTPEAPRCIQRDVPCSKCQVEEQRQNEIDAAEFWARQHENLPALPDQSEDEIRDLTPRKVGFLLLDLKKTKDTTSSDTRPLSPLLPITECRIIDSGIPGEGPLSPLLPLTQCRIIDPDTPEGRIELETKFYNGQRIIDPGTSEGQAELADLESEIADLESEGHEEIPIALSLKEGLRIMFSGPTENQSQISELNVRNIIPTSTSPPPLYGLRLRGGGQSQTAKVRSPPQSPRHELNELRAKSVGAWFCIPDTVPFYQLPAYIKEKLHPKESIWGLCEWDRGRDVDPENLRRCVLASNASSKKTAEICALVEKIREWKQEEKARKWMNEDPDYDDSDSSSDSSVDDVDDPEFEHRLNFESSRSDEEEKEDEHRPQPSSAWPESSEEDEEKDEHATEDHWYGDEVVDGLSTYDPTHQDDLYSADSPPPSPSSTTLSQELVQAGYRSELPDAVWSENGQESPPPTPIQAEFPILHAQEPVDRTDELDALSSIYTSYSDSPSTASDDAEDGPDLEIPDFPAPPGGDENRYYPRLPPGTTFAGLNTDSAVLIRPIPLRPAPKRPERPARKEFVYKPSWLEVWRAKKRGSPLREVVSIEEEEVEEANWV